jgi:D-tyrosyl-tRNA(Tyr) deacylase
MKLLIQRVTEASVTINGEVRGAIGKGYMVLVGCRTGDTEADAVYLAEKLASLRIFEDETGKMNQSIKQVNGEALLISQFTLYADTRKGNRPSFVNAGDPAVANELYEKLIEQVSLLLGNDKVATGEFGADMKVALVNDGPVTIELCSDTCAWHKE